VSAREGRDRRAKGGASQAFFHRVGQRFVAHESGTTQIAEPIGLILQYAVDQAALNLRLLRQDGLSHVV